MCVAVVVYVCVWLWLCICLCGHGAGGGQKRAMSVVGLCLPPRLREDLFCQAWLRTPHYLAPECPESAHTAIFSSHSGSGHSDLGPCS